MSFASLVPERFLSCVEEQRPRALIILAHLFSLSSHAKDIWWIGQTAYREVYAIRDQTPEHLVYLLDEPLKLLDTT